VSFESKNKPTGFRLLNLRLYTSVMSYFQQKNAEGKNSTHHAQQKLGYKSMELFEEIDTIIEELKDEANNLKIAESKEEEKEALKEMLDALMRGARQVQEKLDQFNDRRYR
jgi:hypothetical protein